MSRLGKRRANCASEEEEGRTVPNGIGGGEEELALNGGAKRQQFRLHETSTSIGGYTIQSGLSHHGFYPNSLGTTSAAVLNDYGGLDIQGYMINQQFVPASAYPLNYYQIANEPAAGEPFHSSEQLSAFRLETQQQQVGNDGKHNSSTNAAGKDDNERRHQQLLPAEAIQNGNLVTNQHTQLFPNRSPYEPFCTVPGRTSLLSSTTKYKVTIGEIQRRINPPECLNASLMGGILRKAKSKDGGKALRESLKRIGLSLPAGRRKSACVTAFTALVEEEAIHMANDFHGVLQRDFPAKDIGIFLNSQFLRYSAQSSIDAELLARRKAILNCTRVFIKELTDLMMSDRSPICDRRPELVLESNIQKPLTHFSLITHGFGGIALLSMLEMLNQCLGESLKSLEKMFGVRIVQPDNQFEQVEPSRAMQPNGF